MFKALKRRWEIESDTQAAIIFTVFGINGSLTAWIAKPAIDWIGLTTEIIPPLLLVPLRFVLILPVWVLMLVVIGTVFGQRKFFWEFIKRMIFKALPNRKLIRSLKPQRKA